MTFENQFYCDIAGPYAAKNGAALGKLTKNWDIACSKQRSDIVSNAITRFRNSSSSKSDQHQSADLYARQITRGCNAIWPPKR